MKAAGGEHHALDTLLLRPEQFPSYLCSHLGFRLLHILEAEAHVAGFMRTVYAFQKQDATVNVFQKPESSASIFQDEESSLSVFQKQESSGKGMA